MLTIVKIALIGTSIFGTTNNIIVKPPVIRNVERVVQYTNTINVEDYIGEEKALEIALKDAGVKAKETTYSRVHLDMDDGVVIYDVEFMVGDKEYDYDIDAATGNILSSDFDIEGNNAATTAKGSVTKDDVIKAALKDAGVKEKDTTYLYVHLDHDDGAEIYEVEFMVGNKEYDYDIDANTGKILSKDFDIENVGTSTSKSAVSKDQAKEIAVKDAGLTVNDVNFKKVKQELDDGIEKIKVEFVHGETEYEYDIDAATGAILEVSTDSIYDD